MSSVSLVLLVVCGIVFSITFVEKLPQSTGVMNAAMTAFIALLEYVPLFLPLGVFMGTLLASYTLTKSSEGVILSSAGLSQYKLMKPFLLAAIVLGIISSAFINPYSVKLSLNNIQDSKLSLIDGAVWLRETTPNGITTLRATGISKKVDGKLYFKNATLFTQTGDYKLGERIESQTIYLDGGNLRSDKANIYKSDGANVKGAKWETPTLLTPEIIMNRYLNPDQISVWKLPTFILEMQKIGINTHGHLVQFWILFLMPLVLISMVVLGIAFSQTHERRNFSFGIKFGTGIIACFALYFITKVFSALGASGELPALLAVASTPFIIIAAAGIFIVSFDTI